MKTATLKSRQRAKVLDAYRARGRRNNSLWLVYSVKTNRDWLLTSNRQLVHWLFFLESAHGVKDFKIEADEKDPRGSSYVNVLRVDGTREKHVIESTMAAEVEIVSLLGQTTQRVASDCVRVFTDAELRPIVPIAMRWQKALAYASVLRDQEHLPVRLALVPLLSSREKGTLADVLENTNDFNQALVIGMLIRLTIEGYLEIDLTKHGLAFKSQWRLARGEQDVES